MAPNPSEVQREGLTERPGGSLDQTHPYTEEIWNDLLRERSREAFQQGFLAAFKKLDGEAHFRDMEEWLWREFLLYRGGKRLTPEQFTFDQ